MELVRQWNWLMREMIAVMVLTATLLSALAYLAVVYLPLLLDMYDRGPLVHS